ncbi:lipid II flippase Amj family protein [Aurantiacibacter luteus]|uniref:Lipid II flippase Amj n=1 Tax=Aurantiacibacter luteus TaxID=1581420 RepID=A0A0G9MVA4_9SPHN|nr:lipid II flippase Amj family protein [Aurantiacibacter luteus]KLE34651.1 membrane protein [Aurantiacibacter luteus]
MDRQLVIICLLTVVIHLIGTLAYAARIAGVRTRRIAMSFALFNALVLVSRLSNGFLAPLIAKRVENALADEASAHLLLDFRVMIAASTVGVIVGVLLVPSTQRVFAKVIEQMREKKSLARLALRTATPAGLRTLRDAATLPGKAHLTNLRRPKSVGWGILGANCVAQAILVTGVLASIYAGYLNPEYRVTASQLSALINGFATILLFLVIDPQLSMLTDDVVDGQVSEPAYRQAIVWISGSRLMGTLLAQALFVPAALAIAWVANTL